MGQRGPVPDLNSARSSRRGIAPSWVNPQSNVVSIKSGKLLFPMPQTLSEVAKEFWVRNVDFVVEHGLLDENTLYSFTELCRLHSETQRIQSALDKEGFVITTKGGNQKPHPLFKVLLEVDRKFLKLLSEFGLTPLGRLRLGIRINSGPLEEEDPFD